MWPLRIAIAKLRPFNTTGIARIAVVASLLALFLAGDYAMFRKLFEATMKVEAETPLFALALLRNLLSLVFLVAVSVLFSSSLTVAIGAFFTDLDLDIHHAAPRSALRVAVIRWLKALLQSATVVFLFLIPLVIAFGRQYEKPWTFYPIVVANMLLLLSLPVSLSSAAILALVRWFPVRRVHQIVATLAVIVLTVVVVAFRMSRPERFFATISTDDVRQVLRAIELPAMRLYPSSSLAELMTSAAPPLLAGRIAWSALIAFALFIAIARAGYFVAFVRARESMAPVAIGAASTTRLLDRLLRNADPQLRAMLGKEVRTVTRDAAQWSQLLLMLALMFIYLYNIRMLPLGGDARATLVAYANLGMAGFVIAAICLRFAYPSVSAEGKAFWLLETAPISYRQFIRVKVFVYAAPLVALALVLTAFANVLLDAGATVWIFTMIGAPLMAITLVCLGVGLGAVMPNFNAENPLQVGLSLGGFAYMAISMAYVGAMMVLMARPVMHYLLARVLRVTGERGFFAMALPVVIALTLSAIFAVLPIRAAENRLTHIRESD